AITPDGRRAVVAGAWRSGRIFRLGDPSNPVPFGELKHPVQSLALTPDGKRFLTGTMKPLSGGDASLDLRDLEPAQPVAPIDEYTAGINSIAFSRDGLRFALGGNFPGPVVAESPFDRPRPRKLPLGNGTNLSCVVFGRDARVLYGATKTNVLETWRLDG